MWSAIFWLNELITYFYPNLDKTIVLIVAISCTIWKMLEIAEYISKK